MTSSISLAPIGDLDGKPAFEGTGTVAGNAGTVVNIYWMPAPDNLWVLAFDGQPYFFTTCNTDDPPGTANPYCSWVAVDGEACTGGASLSIAGAVVLPISLSNFTANKNGRAVLLKWNTSSESNNKGFEIQKSADALNWTNIGFVKGHAFSTALINYVFTDAAPYSGKNQYRLIQVDMDGKKTYSSVVNVDFKTKSFYTISNNPGRGIYNINMPAGTERLDLKVLDVNGKVLYKKTTSMGNQLLDISNFSPGMYWLQLIKDGSLFTEKIIKL